MPFYAQLRQTETHQESLLGQVNESPLLNSVNPQTRTSTAQHSPPPVQVPTSPVNKKPLPTPAAKSPLPRIGQSQTQPATHPESQRSLSSRQVIENLPKTQVLKEIETAPETSRMRKLLSNIHAHLLRLNFNEIPQPSKVRENLLTLLTNLMPKSLAQVVTIPPALRPHSIDQRHTKIKHPLPFRLFNNPKNPNHLDLVRACGI